MKRITSEKSGICDIEDIQPPCTETHDPARTSSQFSQWLYSPEQKEQWDKTLNGPGYYQVVGEQAYTYLTHRIRYMVENPADPKTVLLIGSSSKCGKFLERMVDCEVIDGLMFMEPRFFRFDDRPDDEGDTIHKSARIRNGCRAVSQLHRNLR